MKTINSEDAIDLIRQIVIVVEQIPSEYTSQFQTIDRFATIHDITLICLDYLCSYPRTPEKLQLARDITDLLAKEFGD